jgi:23S rRNA G2445 N2-methylase RlmL
MDQVFAVTTRGLESVCAAEMGALQNVQLVQTAYRRVSALCQGELANLLNLRTADDVFLELAQWDGIIPQRAALPELRLHSARLDLGSALHRVRQVRPVQQPVRFSVTANFVGKRNYSSDEIKQAVMEGVTSRYAWTYQADDALSEINLRVFIEHEHAVVGMRLGAQALQNRTYKQIHLPGSLKPPAAAAMLKLAGVQPGRRVLDPLCGAGTILVEAGLLGCPALGGDIDRNALSAARQNGQAAGVRLALAAWDARRLPLPNQSAAHIASNLPWGRQVSADQGLAELYARMGDELARLAAPGGTMALLTSLPELVSVPGWSIIQSVEVSIFGQNPHILVLQEA